MSLRVAVLGNDPWSVPSLEAIAAEPTLEVAVVVTNPPRPAGRGDRLRPTAVADAARRLGLPLREVDGVRTGEGANALTASRPDVLAVIAYGELLTPAALGLARYGALNLHFSLLPRWRGASPVRHALLAGDARTGVTVMQIDAGLDTGPILAQLEEDIRDDDDAGALGGRLATLGARLLVGVLQRLPAGDVPARPQPARGVTLAPSFAADDRRLRWEAPADDVVRRVRAFAPDPSATTIFRDGPLKIVRASLEREAATGAPGEVLSSDARGVVVACGEGALRLLEVAPAGRKRMAAGDWARGARFTPGERLGLPT